MQGALPEAQSHEILALVGEFLIPAVEALDIAYACTFAPFTHVRTQPVSPPSTALCVQLIEHCRRAFEAGQRDIPGAALPRLAPLTAMRCRSAALWQKTLDALKVSRYTHDPVWRQLGTGWLGLETPLDVARYLALQQEGGYDMRRVFAPLARCGWRGCLCSVYEPLHPMKTCKRCWVVAYCSATCQTK